MPLLDNPYAVTLQTIYFSIPFLNLTTWHGQVHELERCLDPNRQGPCWRNILNPVVLLNPVRDKDYGFGTFYQRFFHKNFNYKYKFEICKRRQPAV